MSAPIARENELAIGGAKTFTYWKAARRGSSYRTGAASFVAYDQQCTHLLCPVVPAVDLGRLHCPCHNGWFGWRRAGLSPGPPRRTL